MLTFVEVLESTIVGLPLIDDGGRGPGLARSIGTSGRSSKPRPSASHEMRLW